MSLRRALALALLLAAIGAFFAAGLDRYLDLSYLESRRALLESWVTHRPIASAFAYVALYVAVTGLSLPGAAVLTLVGGALFGLLWGTVLVSFASTFGATAAFLLARYLLREAVRARFSERLGAVDEGIRRDGGFYLFALRLVPAIPFFVINLVMGLTPMRARRFAWISQIGMLPGTLVYVNAGTRLGALNGVDSLLSPGLIASFTALGLFPLAARKLVAALRAWRRARVAVRGGGTRP